MPAQTLIFWNARSAPPLPPEQLARELYWGEEVEGLDDLPIREILDRLKAVFPQHEETTGLVRVQGEEGPFDVTWTWQTVRVDYQTLGEADRAKLSELLEAMGCRSHLLSGPRF
jgi:hypothetical protein